MHTRTHTQGSIYKKPLTQLFLLSCVQKKQLPKKHLISSKWYTEPLTVLCISREKKKMDPKSGVVTLLPLLGSVNDMRTKAGKDRSYLSPKGELARSSLLLLLPWIYNKSAGNTARTGGRVKEAHFCSLMSYTVLLSHMFIPIASIVPTLR